MKHPHIPSKYPWEEPLTWDHLLEGTDESLTQHFWDAQGYLLNERCWKSICKEAKEKKRELSHETRKQGLEVIIQAERARDFLTWLEENTKTRDVPHG
jgi:hypothetical protein